MLYQIAVSPCLQDGSWQDTWDGAVICNGFEGNDKGAKIGWQVEDGEMLEGTRWREKQVQRRCQQQFTDSEGDDVLARSWDLDTDQGQECCFDLYSKHTSQQSVELTHLRIQRRW